MKLLDSNIVIYSAAPENEWLRKWLEIKDYAISQISKVEVLGYHLLAAAERRDLGAFLEASLIVPLSDSIADRAIALRQQRKIGLADSLIAATALEGDWELITRNVNDFDWIEGLRWINPFESEQAK